MPIIGSAAGASMRSLGFFGRKAVISGGTRTEYGDFIVFSFTSSGSLTISDGPVKGDFLLVGGGQPGESGTPVPSPKGVLGIRPGVGGDGGVVNAVTGGELTSGTFTVTVGAANAESSIATPTTTVYSAAAGLNNPFTYGTTSTGTGSGGGAGSGVNGGAAPAAPPTVTLNSRQGGAGGAGASNSWRTGSPVFYGGGGGGGSSYPYSAPETFNIGGSGGGGTGGDYSPQPSTTAPRGTANPGFAGTANTGGGGGGGGATGYPFTPIPAPQAPNYNPKGAAGGAGGSGIVVLRFPKSTVI